MLSQMRRHCRYLEENKERYLNKWEYTLKDKDNTYGIVKKINKEGLNRTVESTTINQV